MIKKFSLAALTMFVLVIFLAGCSSTQVLNSSSGAAQNQVGQVSGSQGTTADSAKESTNVEGPYVRSDNGEGGVQVEAALVTPEYLKAIGKDDMAKKYDLNKNIVIEIAMTTHMGDLSQYPILEKTELTVDGKAAKPSKWDISSDSSHHPQGFLVFPVRSNVETKDKKLQLDIKELNGVPDRKFNW